MREALTNMLVFVAATAAFSMLLTKINTRKLNRSKQTLMPWIALAYCAVVVGVMIKYWPMLDEYRQQLYDQTQFWLDYRYDIVLLNAAVMAVFVVLKTTASGILALVFRGVKRIDELTDKYYNYDEDYSEWFLQNKWLNFREMFRWFVSVGTVGTGIILWVVWQFGMDYPVWCVYIFPTMPLLILIEIYNFLNGYTKTEFEHDIMGDDSYAQHISNFYRVREIFEKLFPRELLTASTGCEYSNRQDIINLLETMGDSEDEIQKIVAEFFELNGTDEIYDADCIHAAHKLLKHENVVFFNPFYRDLGKYLILPMLNALLEGKKCLIVVGRSSTKEDIKAWVNDLLWEYGKIRTLWRVKDLSFKEPECEVGVLSFSQLYDLQVINTNKEFLQDVGFVFMSEPSLVVNTGQIGLSILAQQMCTLGAQPVYCISDRIVDGLVDTLSHLFRAEMTEVVAPPVSRNIHTSMGWNADGDFLRQKLFGKQTRYLGNGLELAAVAIKNQIPEVSWFGETKVPIRDIKWIAGQYYPTICKYMNLPVQQQSIYDKIKFISNIWSVPEEKEQFVIAEDEFVNLFSTMRVFLSRGREQTFVNVLSENYLLRDYMRCNTQMFASNPDAIPSIVPDYAKTERNTLLKLLMLMTYRDVSETEIRHEFRLVGLETDDVLHTMTGLLAKYTYATDEIFDIRTIKNDFDGTTISSENIYRLIPDMFDQYFGETLKNAYYICEDEKQESEYIDAKLFGHVTQVILPGQFVTYDGKYYMVQHISAKNGVLLRRASKLFDGRKYYRQVRKYYFNEEAGEEIVSLRTVMDIELAEIVRDFSVRTTGYLELKSNNDLRSAKEIDFSNDPSVECYTRNYRNKKVLRVKFPDTTDRVRFTICLLLSELFRSIFPDAYHYIAAVTVLPENVDGILNHTVYTVEGNVEDEYIYIIEDSDVDLGLLEAVEKNLMQFMEIVTDFLYWHFEKMREPAAKDPEIATVEFPKPDKKRRKKFTEMATRIRKLFGGKKEEEVRIESVEAVERKKPEATEAVEATEATEASEDVKGMKMTGNTFDDLKDDGTTKETGESGVTKAAGADTTGAETADAEPTVAEPVADTPVADAPIAEVPTAGPSVKTVASGAQPDSGYEPSAGESPDFVAIDGTDIFDNDGISDDDEYLEERFAELGIVSPDKTRYQTECYLKYGFEEIDSRIQLEEVRKYLTVRGFSNSALTKARKRDLLTKTFIDLDTVNHCDFCGMPLSGVSYERLTDGRIRCNDCTASAITSLSDFKELFHRHIRMMESFYGISFRVAIGVRTVDAKVIARGFGSVYEPTTEVAVRVVGYAQRKHGQFSLFVENGSPRLATIDTMIHELTHIWQYINWDDREIKKHYPTKQQRDIVYEGMAMWASVQYLYLIGETSYAQQREELARSREDVYGIGFRMYCEKYPLIKDSSLVHNSPFKEFPPI